jgi:hypothetical protein
MKRKGVFAHKFFEALDKGFNAKTQRRKETKERKKDVKHCLDNDLRPFILLLVLLCAFASLR